VGGRPQGRQSLWRKDFVWYEDPYRDGGISHHGHEKLGDHPETRSSRPNTSRSRAPYGLRHQRGHRLRPCRPRVQRRNHRRDEDRQRCRGVRLDAEFHASGPAQRHGIAATSNANYYELALVNPDGDNPVPATARWLCSNALPPVLISQRYVVTRRPVTAASNRQSGCHSPTNAGTVTRSRSLTVTTSQLFEEQGFVVSLEPAVATELTSFARTCSQEIAR